MPVLVAVVRCVHHRSLAIGGEHAVETRFFGLAGEGDLFAANNIARTPLEIRHLWRELLDMLVEALGPERQPAGTAFHEADAQLRIAVEHTLAALDKLTDADLLDLTTLARAFGYPGTIEALDAPMSPRGYRVLARVPRLQFHQVRRLVASFGTLQGLLAATAADLQAVDGIGGLWARHIREGLSRLAETSITGPFD